MKNMITFKIEKKFLDKILSGEKKYEFRFLKKEEYDFVAHLIFHQLNRIFNIGFFVDKQFYYFEKVKMIDHRFNFKSLLQFMEDKKVSDEEIRFVKKLEKEEYYTIVVFEFEEEANTAVVS